MWGIASSRFVHPGKAFCHGLCHYRSVMIEFHPVNPYNLNIIGTIKGKNDLDRFA